VVGDADERMHDSQLKGGTHTGQEPETETATTEPEKMREPRSLRGIREEPDEKDQEPLVTENGFFFHEGEYVPPPYKVTCDSEGVYVNGICIEKAPTPPKRKPVPETDPGPFQWTPELKAKGFFKSGFREHLSDRWRYWEERYGSDEAFQRVVRYLGEQPQVVKVESKGTDIAYELDTGETRYTGYPRVHRDLQHDVQRTDQTLKRNAAHLHKVLSEGRAFFAVKGVEISMSLRGLREVYEIMVSDETMEERIESLERYFPGRAETVIMTFKDTADLRKRMSEMGVE